MELDHLGRQRCRSIAIIPLPAHWRNRP
jgi:hypothetical protein